MNKIKTYTAMAVLFIVFVGLGLLFEHLIDTQFELIASNIQETSFNHQYDIISYINDIAGDFFYARIYFYLIIAVTSVFSIYLQQDTTIKEYTYPKNIKIIFTLFISGDILLYITSAIKVVLNYNSDIQMIQTLMIYAMLPEVIFFVALLAFIGIMWLLHKNTESKEDTY